MSTPVDAVIDPEDFDPTDPADLRRAARHLIATRAHGFDALDPDAPHPPQPAYPTDTPTYPVVRAIADLHANSRGNRNQIVGLHPNHPEDWLIVAGDVAERLADITDVLATLAERFATVMWVPGNHELWGGRSGFDEWDAPSRYDLLVHICRELGILTPEDPYPIWTGTGGPVTIAPLFLLYDYSWRPNPTQPLAQALAEARERRVVATDEYLIDPHPYASIADWCAERLETTTTRLARIDSTMPTVLVNHWPLIHEPVQALRFPDFAMWCGTVHTEQWPARYRAQTCVYGHLHIPRSLVVDGIRHEEVSLGYPREWSHRGQPLPAARQIVPIPPQPPVRWLVDDTGAPHIAKPGETGARFAADTATTDWENLHR